MPGMNVTLHDGTQCVRYISGASWADRHMNGFQLGGMCCLRRLVNKPFQIQKCQVRSLSETYGIDYPDLMEKAGFISHSTNRQQNERHGRVATFANHNLTADEESSL